MTAFARAEGYYEGLPRDLRRAQLDRILTLLDQLYPSLRLYLFDARWVFSAPITVFGPLLAVIYLGRHYLAFRDPDRVASLRAQFDWLIREAAVGARDMPDAPARAAGRDRLGRGHRPQPRQVVAVQREDFARGASAGRRAAAGSGSG